MYDVKNPYSASKSAAQFIKENHLDSTPIYGLGYKTSAIQPYFKGGIYKNYDNKSYWQWKTSFYQKQAVPLPPSAQVVVIDELVKNEYSGIISKLEKNYKFYYFKGNLFAKGHLDESESYIIFVK